MKHTKGFSLIELLVVIAIIALLASLVAPGWSRVRDRALTTACAANARVIGRAAMLWASDWNGRLPPYEISDVASDQAYAERVLGGRAQAWTDYRILGQYLNNEGYQAGGGSGQSPGFVVKTSAAFCPADRQDFPHWSGVAADPGRDAASYGWNVQLQRDPNISDYRGAWGTQVTLRRLNTALSSFNAAQTILAIDAHYPRWDPGWGNTPPAYGAPEPYSGVWQPNHPYSWWNWAMRHAGQQGANIVFIDGHVEFVEGDLATPIANRQYLFKKLSDY